jgi:hypothetical protein
MRDYLTEGAGRYALPSSSPIVDAFFGDLLIGNGLFRRLNDGTYNLQQLRTALSLANAENGATSFGFYHYTTDITSFDWIERAYIFGTTNFDLRPNMLFEVNGLNYTIENPEVVANNDNFDYDSNWLVDLTANSMLKSAFDPYNLIPATGSNGRLEIVYTGPGRHYTSYGLGSYLGDQAADVLFSVIPLLDIPAAALQVAAQLAGLATNTGCLGSMNGTDRFSCRTPDGKKIIYGTVKPEAIDPSSSEEIVLLSGYQMVGGAGNDSITGSLLYSDELWGGVDNDDLQGLGGGDTLRGGSGEDVAIFRGDCLDYDIVRNGDGSITVNHARGSIFGADDDTDTLFDKEKARFGDGKELDLTLSEIHGCTERPSGLPGSTARR